MDKQRVVCADNGVSFSDKTNALESRERYGSTSNACYLGQEVSLKNQDTV